MGIYVMGSLKRLMMSVSLGAFLSVPGLAMANISMDEIIKMTNIGVSDGVIITAIESSGAVFELTPADIQRLKDAGVSQDIINSMSASSSPSAAPPATEGPVAPTVSEPIKNPAPTAPSVTSPPPVTEERAQPAPPRQTIIDPTAAQPLPAALKEVEKRYKAGKFTSAAVEAYDLLTGPNQTKYEDWRPEILYWLAKSLLKLGYIHSAHDLMLTVSQSGPGSRNFSNSLIYLTVTSRKLRDYDGLAAAFDETQPDDVPPKAKNAFLYLRGKDKYEAEDFADALSYLERVSQRSEFFIPARYLEGLIRYRQGDNTRAAMIFQEIVTADNVRGNPTDIRNIQDQSIMNIGRIYYRVQDFLQAQMVYNLVPRDSDYWPQALYESAYSNFWLQDYNTSLGQILTIYSPFFGEGIFAPEATILEALTYFNLCEYERVIQLVDTFQANWKPIRDDLRGFVAKHETDPRKVYKYLSTVEEGTRHLPLSLLQELSDDKDLQDLRYHYNVVSTELALLDQQNVRWRNSPLGKQLASLLRQDLEKLETEAGDRMLERLRRLDKQISGFIGESDIIEFEVLSAQKDTYEEKFRNPEFVETFEQLEYSYATEPTLIYWPFTGEFWEDELGYYRFTEKGSCRM